MSKKAPIACPTPPSSRKTRLTLPWVVSRSGHAATTSANELTAHPDEDQRQQPFMPAIGVFADHAPGRREFRTDDMQQEQRGARCGRGAHRHIGRWRAPAGSLRLVGDRFHADPRKAKVGR
jgi:hypothetical protein